MKNRYMENAFAAVSKQLNDADVVQTEAKENRCIIHCKKRNEGFKTSSKVSDLNYGHTTQNNFQRITVLMIFHLFYLLKMQYREKMREKEAGTYDRTDA